MKLSELSPFPVFFNWEGTNIELKPFSLRAITWAERFFSLEGGDGFKRMDAILRNHEGPEILYNTLIDIVFYLGHEGFEDIGIGSPCQLKKKVKEHSEQIEILIALKEAVEETLVISFPKAKKGRPKFNGGKEFNKPGDQDQEENWEQIFIEFFRSGEIDIEKFMNFTMRQIHGLLPELMHQKQKDLNLLSDIIQRKIAIKKPRRKEREMEFTEKDVETFEKMHQKLVEQSRIH